MKKTDSQILHTASLKSTRRSCCAHEKRILAKETTRYNANNDNCFLADVFSCRSLAVNNHSCVCTNSEFIPDKNSDSSASFEVSKFLQNRPPSSTQVPHCQISADPASVQSFGPPYTLPHSCKPPTEAAGMLWAILCATRSGSLLQHSRRPSAGLCEGAAAYCLTLRGRLPVSQKRGAIWAIFFLCLPCCPSTQSFHAACYPD